jgi:hypothetical protein
MVVEQDDAGTVEHVTYLLRSDYTGQAGDFAWVIPLPAAPEDVEASSDSWVFQNLDESTGPTFMAAADGSGVGCGCPGAGYGGALVDWLNVHGY